MRTAGALAALLLITVGLYWKLTLSDRYTWLENPDHANLIRPWLDYEARELHAGRIPLWDPYLWAGQPLHAQMEPGLANPFNWLLFATPVRDGHLTRAALDWYWVLIHWVAAAFCFWLCRDLGCGYLASVVGGAIYGFLGYVGWVGTTCFSMSCLWVPVALLFFARVNRGERPVSNAALCGAALGAGFLMGHHNVPIYLVVTLGVAWAWLLLRRRTDRRLWVAAAVCLVVWLLVGAVQTLPTIEYGRQALRWVGLSEPLSWSDKVPYSVHAEYSLQARSLPGIVFPGFAVHASPFVGVVALMLAMAAVWRRWKSPDVRLLSTVAAVALLLALGKDTPLHWVAYRFIPMVEKARYPAMAIAIAQCAVAALAALAFAVPRQLLRWLAVPAAVMGLAAVALYFANWVHPTLVTAAVALVLAALLRIERAIPAAVLVLIVAEAASYPPPILREREFPGSYASLIASQSDLATFLKSQPGWFRTEFNEDDVPYNFGDYYGVEEFSGYVPGMSARLNRILGEATTRPRYGVRYYVGKAPKSAAQIEVFQSASGVRVFENPGVGEPLSVWRDTPCARTDKLRVVSRTSEEAVFEGDLACPGLVVAGDPYYRGWRATVDGKRVPIQEFESGVRAVRAGSGNHRVVFRYRPLPVYLGAALTICGLLLTAALRLKAV
jgi:hypothetical protein